MATRGKTPKITIFQIISLVEPFSDAASGSILSGCCPNAHGTTNKSAAVTTIFAIRFISNNLLLISKITNQFHLMFVKSNRTHNEGHKIGK